MSPPTYADIAIPGVPRPTLTYGIPDRFRERLRPGMRVHVPLGRRVVTGFCIVTHDAAPGMAVKQVRDLPDEEPVFGPRMIELARWIHQYYYCTLGDALKCALPQGLEAESEQYVHISTERVEEAKRRAGKSLRKLAVIDALQHGEYLSVSELESLSGYGSLAHVLRQLEREGTIAIEAVLSRPRVAPKKILAVRLLPPWTGRERLRELMELLEKRAPKQVNILSFLIQSHLAGQRTVPMTELVLRARASSAQVRALEEKEIVAVEQEETVREYRQQYEEAPQQFELTAGQRSVIRAIDDATDAGSFHPFLLHGVTASGKTQVYIEAIRHLFALGRTAIVLVPEISLTPQLIHRFTIAFGKDVAVLHSRMSPGERYDTWRMTMRGKFKVIVGVRSALFAPLDNVGLIIVDEEHEASYKQNDPPPRYHARDAALMRAKIEGAVVVLGSATPSCESHYNAAQGKYTLLELPERVDRAALPELIPVDTGIARKQNLMRGSYSLELLNRIGNRKDKGEGIIILQNRRGFAPHVECHDCGYIEQCVNCSISMTYHKVRHQLRCHYCGDVRSCPDICPRCGGTGMDLIGAGTQRVEEELSELLPEVRVIRMDLDTTSHKGSHDAFLTAFQEGQADVLLGTQMVSKGLDFPRVTLVGVINADRSLLLPDFRAQERTFQMLTQVAGRSGRGHVPGEVIIQTMQPDHPVIQFVLRHDYAGFMEAELHARRTFNYPPYSRLVLIECSGEREDEVRAYAERFAGLIPSRTELFYRHPPTAAAIRRINKRYRYHILLKVNKQRDPSGRILWEYLQRVEERSLAEGGRKGVRVSIDVDPQNLM